MGISGKKAGDKIRWFATFGEPAWPARRRRDLVNPVRSVTVKPANDPSARSIDAPVVFGDIAVDYVTNLVNECEMGSHNCHEHATCTDMAVQYSCACNAPYNGDGRTCSICPSEACWSHNATTNECTLKEDKPECSQLSCSSEVDFVDSANPPQWDADNSKFVYSSSF